MSSDPSLAASFTARRVLTNSNPNLSRWSSETWQAWLRAQRNADLISSSRLLVIVRLTCLEDLPLHVGLMQLTATPGLGCTVVLTFPTEEMTRLATARARRDEWHHLVHILAHSELSRTIDNLSANTLLAVFLAPSVLQLRTLGLLAALLSDASDPTSECPVHNATAFLGRARDFANWYRIQHSAEAFVESLAAVLAQDPERIVTARAIPFPISPGHFIPDGVTPTVQAFENWLEMPGLRNGGELIVSHLRDMEEESIAIVRQRGDLLDPDDRLRIRMPASLLTVTPQTVRAECWKAGERVANRDFFFYVPPSQFKAWMVSAFLNRGGGGNPVIQAFAQGVGCRIAYAEDEPDELHDVPVVWGVLRGSDRILAQAKRQRLYFFYIDHAYFNRGHGKTYRITRNGYEAGPVRKCPEDRISELDVEVRPWQRNGRHIIVCPPTDYFMHAHGCADWLDETLATLQRVTDRPIKVRTKHPLGQQAVPLPKALKRAHALVTHSSNVAIEAACLGTPVFVDAASAAAPVGLTDLSQIETPIYPDREQWLAHLAYNQFSFEEIRNGRAWQMLLELEERDYA